MILFATEELGKPILELNAALKFFLGSLALCGVGFFLFGESWAVQSGMQDLLSFLFLSSYCVCVLVVERGGEGCKIL